jgi:aminopeptidase-like protein
MGIGQDIHEFAKLLWPLNRSITGDGIRATLSEIQKLLPTLEIIEVKTGTTAFDWTIPREWRVRDAYIITPDGEKICDFKKNNLHLVGYSTPIAMQMDLIELQNNLHSLPNQPTAIPFVTSYYQECWGFCISHNDRTKLVDGTYKVYIDSELFDGSLTYGELIIKGETEEEVLISTYVCHPSMANNELSGPTIATFIAKWLISNSNNIYTYRFIFIPETIGSIYYLSRNIDHLKNSVVAGFVLTCLGDNREYSYLPSRNGSTLSDLVAKHILKHICPTFKKYKWADRGSDERQFCSPGIDLPIASIMRTKYGEYPEYHTSLDDLENVVTPAGLQGGYNVIKETLIALEKNLYPVVNTLCEPQLGKRGLYPTLSTKESCSETALMMDVISWSDGSKSLIEIAEKCGVPIWELYPIIDRLFENDLLILNSKSTIFYPN